MYLLDAPCARARQVLRTGSPVFISVNPVEYHGPHLSLHNDSLVCAGFVRDLFTKLRSVHEDWELIEVQDLECGVQPVPGPGSRNIPYPLVRQLILHACRAVADLGAKRVVLMTFHGSPLHGVALDQGVRYLRQRGVHAVAPFNLMLSSLLTVSPSLFDEAFACLGNVPDRELMQQRFRDDFHAGFLETSLALHYVPDSVDPGYVRLPPCPTVSPHRGLMHAAKVARQLGRDRLARELDIAAFGFGWYALRPFPGYTGRPSLANPRSGEAFAQAFLDLVFEDVVCALEGRPREGRPLGWWFTYASLEGRIGGSHVPLEDIGVSDKERENGSRQHILQNC